MSDLTSMMFLFLLSNFQKRKKLHGEGMEKARRVEGFVVQWCNLLTLKSEQSGGVGSSPGRAPPFERHGKGSRTQLGLLCLCDPSAWR